MLVNKDLTQEKVTVFVSGTQIYARIWARSHGRWNVETYFVSYDFLIDEELIDTTIKYIIRIWGLKDPQVVRE